MPNNNYENIDSRVTILENRTNLMEGRLDKFEYANKQLHQALHKVSKKDYSWASDEERNWLIIAMSNLLQWQRRKIAEIVNLSTSQVGNIVNEYAAEYSL